MIQYWIQIIYFISNDSFCTSSMCFWCMFKSHNFFVGTTLGSHHRQVMLQWECGFSRLNSSILQFPFLEVKPAFNTCYASGIIIFLFLKYIYIFIVHVVHPKFVLDTCDVVLCCLLIHVPFYFCTLLVFVFTRLIIMVIITTL